jgi:hypothetical protein
MAAPHLPPEDQELVSRRQGTMEEIETLLALADAAAPLTINEISERLRLPLGALPSTSLQRLVASQLVAVESEGETERYRYAPATPELRRSVDLLRVAYNERPVTLVRLVYQRPTVAQSFADAFRIKRETDG